jgi:hypothetical protein
MSKEIFDQNPSLKEYFETSDGKKFYNDNAAHNHARLLVDKEVKHVKRGATAEETTAEGKTAEGATAEETTDEGATGAEDKTAEDATAEGATGAEGKTAEETTAEVAGGAGTESPKSKAIKAKATTTKKQSNTTK